MSTVLKNGTLKIRGGDGNDKIELNRMLGRTPAMVEIKVNGEVMATVPYSQLRNVKIYGGNGDDNIKIDPSLSLDTTIHGGKGDDTIQGGSGSDKIFGGAGDDVIEGTKGNTNWIDGGSGADTIYHYNGDHVKPRRGEGDRGYLNHFRRV
ncbi:MAG: hypothetical protein HY541_05930 [Deltaproteobacteria bacterium]|nr:hypothetical protein [Deltaproteobacteria bacterium]MBI4412003.1 hypothetical protein [Deltaproteobacteria bacterium]